MLVNRSRNDGKPNHALMLSAATPLWQGQMISVLPAEPVETQVIENRVASVHLIFSGNTFPLKSMLDAQDFEGGYVVNGNVVAEREQGTTSRSGRAGKSLSEMASCFQEPYQDDGIPDPSRTEGSGRSSFRMRA